jgi:uncharacterized membrane protein YfcA
VQSAGDWITAREARRWRSHFRIVGFLYAFIGVTALGLAFGYEDRPHALTPQDIAVAVFGLVQVAAGAAFALRIRWARIPLWPLSVIYLFALPVGTALGGYTLWVLYQTRTAKQPSSSAAA